ncbi:MAG: hypothetical protein Q4G24_14530 [Paracoccus sp. (in: a-proteobacteria)]|uniref:hypothetical protein n=1 Tax=Paracoccus sp. TaxID=267 RepID=UPI0026E008A6|nr:hypothetical protein [Paracoccus sp. (in: a-proteobacteria)]MDO5622673.1 hypothetical protein [Paracoccus sp. (in: a-proteobacteria)]
MLKHRKFPGRLPSSNHQFVIRRANKKGATKLVARERFRDRSASDRRADEGFLAALIAHFGDEPFERGNLDAGRLSWLLNREVVAVGKLDPTSYEQLLRVDLARAEASFPQLFATDSQPEFDWDDDWDEDEDEDDWDEDDD